MGEWKAVTLGYLVANNLADLQTGPFGTMLNASEYKESGTPVIAVQDIGENRFSTHKIKYIDEETSTRLEKYRVAIDDIVFGRKGAVDRRAIVSSKEKGWIQGSDCIRLRLSEVFDAKFISYQLGSSGMKEWLNQHAHGATMPSLNQEILSLLPLLIPPLPEQRAIASVLSSLDDKIDLLHRQNKTLEAMAETLFRQWFVEEADEGWEEKKLGDVLDFIVDNRGKTAPTSESGIPLIATNCIKNDNIFPVYEKVRYISESVYKEWFRAHPEPGDILFVNKGTPGCINLVPDPVDFCIAQDMVALRVNRDIINNYFLFLYLRSEDFQNQIVNSSVGTTIPHLKKTDLVNFSLVVPSISLLSNFEELVSPLFIKMNKNVIQQNELDKIRDSLLPKLMSGEVQVGHSGVGKCR